MFFLVPAHPGRPRQRAMKRLCVCVCVSTAVRSTGLFTPDMAFEAIVKKQIEQLKAPMLKCVDMVVEELSKVVHSCSERVCIRPLIYFYRLQTRWFIGLGLQCFDAHSLHIHC